MRIVHVAQPTGQALCVAALARSQGLDPEWVPVDSESTLLDSLSVTAPPDCCVVVDLAGVASAFPSVAGQLRNVLRASRRHVLLLVTEADDAVSLFLAEVTGHAVIGVVPLEARDILSATFLGPLTSQLAGHTYPQSGTCTLRLSTRSETFETILSVAGGAGFGRLTAPGEEHVFVWGAARIFDVLRPLATEIEFETATAEFIPAIVFLRASCGDRCWHNPSPTAALVIDDPLLQQRYGCLDFATLLSSARRNRYHVTLGFIPWNHWRTRKRNTSLFRQYSDVFSLCVHGNDHTKGEFATSDRNALAAKAAEAHSRMEALWARTGLPFESVMVFPQELFSVQALHALADTCRFSAVANTRRIPADPAASGMACGADLLLPVEDSWSGVPIMKRHYPSEGIGKFALALFLGRPIVVAEHHGYFAGGPQRIEALAADLRRIDEELRWTSMAQCLKQLSWRRRVSASHWQLRFFADDFELLNDFEGQTHFQLSKRIPTDRTVESVHVGGVAVEFDTVDALLCFELPAIPCGRHGIAVRYRKRPGPKPSRSALGYRLAVATRRFLSELRDAGSAWRPSPRKT